MKKTGAKGLPRAVKALIAVLCVIAVIAAAELILVNHHSDPADVAAFEDVQNPFFAADGETQLSAHRSGAGIMPEETMMASNTARRTTAFPLTGLNSICT